MIYSLSPVMTASWLARVCGGQLTDGDVGFGSLITDSRERTEGALFVCIKGERFDGHDFASAAVENGAGCLMVERRLDIDVPQIIVGDSIEALGRAAAAKRREIAPVTAAITGSVGKTTTKQLTSSIFSRRWKTLRTEGNLNNQLGLPLTLLGLTPAHEAAVLEFGMSARGEISRLSKIAAPDIAVITNIGSSHLEYLHTRENIRDAKLEIRDGMEGGSLILNGDEPLLEGVKDAFYVSAERSNAFAYISRTEISERGSDFDLWLDGRLIKNLFVPAAGSHVVFDAALAAAASNRAGLNEEEIREGIASFENTGMRQNISHTGDITFVEDCYNASPESMRAALNVLRSIKANRRIAALGDMLELGERSAELHRKVGQYAAEKHIDALFTFGTLADSIAEGGAAGGIYTERFPRLDEPEKLADALYSYARPGDCILFKASRSVKMERVSELLRKKYAK